VSIVAQPEWKKNKGVSAYFGHAWS
jgi:hypothetical protein